MRTSKKVTLAAAMVVALIIGMATPAAAAGPYDLDVMGGTLTTDLGIFDLTPGSQGIPPCDDKPSTLSFWTDEDSAFATPGYWSADGTFSGQFQLPAGSGNWYQADFTIQYGSGGGYTANGTPPPDYFLDGVIGFSVDLSYIGSASDPDCVKDSICVVTGAFTITYGEFNGSLPAPSVGDQAVIDADTVTTGFPLVAGGPNGCAPPFNSLNGTDAFISGLVMEVV